MELDDALAEGYRWETRHEGTDPAGAVAAMFSRQELEEEAARLAAVADRDHIARRRLLFLQRTLAIQGTLSQ